VILPHNKELIGFVPLADLYTDYKDHHRLTVFANKGLTCVSCGRVGTFLALGRDNMNSKTHVPGAVHIDLYTDDFVLMTVDHIVPKAVGKMLGWTRDEREALSNKQTMCDPCNGGKGDRLVTDEQQAKILALRIKEKQQKRNVIGSETIMGLVPNIHALLGDTV
jgi:5-methylcytosine-specific restriction endonuclease McrA